MTDAQVTYDATKPAWIKLLVLGHVVGVLVVIVATRLILGSDGSLTIPNQVPWTSILWAQSA